MGVAQDVIVYRARRLGLALWTLVFVALTALGAVGAYAGIIAADEDARLAWLVVPVTALCALLTYRFGRSLIWPAQLEISSDWIRWTHFDTADGRYGWEDVDGPYLKNVLVRNEISFVHFVVKSTGGGVDLALNDIGGATYDEVAAVISSAREGKIISPEKWRIQNPRHRLRRRR